MKDYPFDRVIVGCFLTICGLGIIIFHRAIKERHDYWRSKDFPIGDGEMWTGKYSRGGLIFAYTVIILIGLAFLGIGVFQIVNALSG